jgi:LmbE family N-acetylglucosaminyl deacetylase
MSLYIKKYFSLKFGRYLYDVRADQIIDWDRSECRKVLIQKDVAVSGFNLVVSGVAGYDTCFLNIKVDSGLSGIFKEPRVLIENSKGKKYVQILEYRCSGVRPINVSSLLSPNENVLSLCITSSWCRILDIGKHAILYNNSDLIDSKKIVVAPHPDDAEIAAYGLYKKSNKNTFILTVSGGEGGRFVKSENEKRFVDNKYLSLIRFLDSITIPLRAGIPHDNVINMGYFDNTLEEMYRDKVVSVKSLYYENLSIDEYRGYNISEIRSEIQGGANWGDFVSDLSSVISKINPDVFVSPYPVLDTHEDHKYSTVALVEAIMKSGLRSGYLCLYSNRYVQSEYFPYGPAGSIYSVLPLENNGLFFDRIFSLDLGDGLCVEKKISLEAHYDLRESVQFMSIREQFHYILNKIKGCVYNTENSYYRRAMMSNEIFYVIRVEKLYDEIVRKSVLGEI